MRKSHLNDEFLVLLGPIISRCFACSNEEKKTKTTKGACSSPNSMAEFRLSVCHGAIFPLPVAIGFEPSYSVSRVICFTTLLYNSLTSSSGHGKCLWGRAKNARYNTNVQLNYIFKLVKGIIPKFSYFSFNFKLTNWIWETDAQLLRSEKKRMWQGVPFPVSTGMGLHN